MVGTVKIMRTAMGNCWAWHVNVPANIMQPVEGSCPGGTVKTQESAKRVVEFLAGESGLVPLYDMAGLIAEGMIENG